MKRYVETLRRIQNLIHFGIVYSQKFVCSSDSVGIIMLSFRAFLDDELIHRRHRKVRGDGKAIKHLARQVGFREAAGAQPTAQEPHQIVVRYPVDVERHTIPAFT